MEALLREALRVEATVDLNFFAPVSGTRNTASSRTRPASSRLGGGRFTARFAARSRRSKRSSTSACALASWFTLAAWLSRLASRKLVPDVGRFAGGLGRAFSSSRMRRPHSWHPPIRWTTRSSVRRVFFTWAIARSSEAKIVKSFIGTAVELVAACSTTASCAAAIDPTQSRSRSLASIASAA